MTTPNPIAHAFFYEHAGFSYDPKTETPEDGKQKTARALAIAEADASARGFSFRWEIDPFGDSSEWSDEKPAWSVWECACYDSAGRVLASLGGIDFGRDGKPWGNHYRRVVEAELAAEALSAIEEEQPLS